MTPLMPGAGPPPTRSATVPRGLSDMVGPHRSEGCGRHWPTDVKHEEWLRQFQENEAAQKRCGARDDYACRAARRRYFQRGIGGVCRNESAIWLARAEDDDLRPVR